MAGELDARLDKIESMLHRLVDGQERMRLEIDAMNERLNIMKESLDELNQRVDELSQRTARIEEGLTYLGEWTEHDRKIWRLKRKQA